MERSASAGPPSGDARPPDAQTVLLPARWWAVPGFAIDYDRRTRLIRRSDGAVVRAYTLVRTPGARPIAAGHAA